jgi:hypothetical protein
MVNPGQHQQLHDIFQKEQAIQRKEEELKKKEKDLDRRELALHTKELVTGAGGTERASSATAGVERSMLTVLTPALDALRQFKDPVVGALCTTIKTLGNRCDVLISGLQQLAQIKEVASEISNNPLDGVDSAHLTTQKELQQKIIELQYTDEDEPLEIDRKIREQLMAFKAFNSYQAKMITDVSGLSKKVHSPTACDTITTSVAQLQSYCQALASDMQELLAHARAVCTQHELSCAQDQAKFVKEQHQIFETNMSQWTTSLSTYIRQREKMLESDKEHLAERRSQTEKYQAIDPELTPIRKEIDRLQKRVADAHEAIAHWREQRTVIANLRLSVATNCPELKRKRKRSQSSTPTVEEPPAQRRNTFSGVGSWFGLGSA